MVICPKCKAENRQEAAFCARCGTILFTRHTPSKSAEQPLSPQPEEQSELISPEEEVVFLPGFIKRPEGTIFGDRFQYDSLIFQDEHEIQYLVTEIDKPNTAGVRVCSNPECHTLHCPVSSDTEKFCTQCGQPLDTKSPLFLLQESDTDKFSSIQPVIDLHMVHPNIHPPVVKFQQEISGTVRYYLVTPYSDNLPSQPEITEGLEWGIQLSQALDYLQNKGIALGEELDQTCIGLADRKVVWKNFSLARVLPVLTDREKINNVRHLALAMYSWMTGKTTYSLDPYLPPVLNSLFQTALVGEGFTSPAEFTNQIMQVKSAGVTRLALDYQVGKRTHVGKMRDKNEDSLLCVQLSNMHQGIIQPISLVAVADGMGGHSSGELASSMVIDAIAQIGAFELVALQNPSYEEYGDWIKRAMQSANQSVYEARQNAGNDMGSTLVLGLIIGSQAYLGHIGDSRIYLINKDSIKQLTNDHSLVQHLVNTGKITMDEARVHPQRNVIYRSLGEKPQVEADYLSQQLFPGDSLLFCTDGLTSMLEDSIVHKTVLGAGSPQAACDQLIEEANIAGGADNLAIAIVKVLSF